MILVTGATGHVGRQVVTQLQAENVKVRALSRTATPGDFPPGVDAVRADLAKPGAIDPHLDGVDAVFLVWPLLTADAAPPLIDAIARRARRVVYLSSAGVPDEPGIETDPITTFHAAIEALVRASDLDWTFLRPSGFASNALGWADQVRSGDVVRAPVADLTRPLIHEADIAAAGVRALVDDGHAGLVHHLTGPARVSQADQVRAIGEAVGRPLRYEEQPISEARAQMTAAWGDAGVVDQVIAAWSGMVADPEPVTDTVEKLTGAPARTFRHWAFDHADDFTAPRRRP